jgi:hypothetical protein
MVQIEIANIHWGFYLSWRLHQDIDLLRSSRWLPRVLWWWMFTLTASILRESNMAIHTQELRHFYSKTHTSRAERWAAEALAQLVSTSPSRGNAFLGI